MKIGVPKESKNGEFRVGLTPESVKELIANGHEVIIEHSAGIGANLTDQEYINAGATIGQDYLDVITQCDMVVKVKEPNLTEASLFKENQLVFCYLHLAPNPKLTQVLLDRKIVGVAFETITSRLDNTGYPLLCPMSIVAGRMATQVGATLLQCSNGGRGVLLSGVPGVVKGAKVVILGGGVVGQHSADVAVGMGAEVVIFDRNEEKLKQLQTMFSGKVATYQISNTETFEREMSLADVAIGAVHVAGALTPHLVSEEMVKKMKKGSVIVDVAIDQGGCFETSVPTSHEHPTYVKHDVIHYCVPNMPGSVPFTSTYALNNFLLPFVMDLANDGFEKQCQINKHIRDGVHIYKGNITNQYVANSIENGKFVDLVTLL